MALEHGVEIVRSRRRTMTLSVTKDLRVVVKAPLFLPQAQIDAFVAKHEEWVARHLLLQAEANAKARNFSAEETQALKRRAAQLLEQRVPYYAARMGVAPAGVKVTQAAARWGSCSAKDRLCFSCRVALLPPEAADYVVVHELAHIRQKNHGPLFYAEVAKILPDYRRRIALLKRAQRELGL